MPVDITFIRHGQTEGNAAGRWQGHTDSSLTELGRRQAKALGARLAARQFDLIVSSDLVRTGETAAALDRTFVTDPRWREPFFGTWENRSTSEIIEESGDDLQALFAGEDIALGGGERPSEVVARVRDALDGMLARLDGDGSAAVVSHGMSLLLLISALLETKLPSPLRLLGNTAIAELTLDDGEVRMRRYNDDTHLGDLPPTHFQFDHGVTELLMVRHGQTTSNVEGRWQGHQDGELTEEGRRQIGLLAGSFPAVGAMYSSPLLRAAHTAGAIAARQGLEVNFDERLKEISFGQWEGLTRSEIKGRFPESEAFFAGRDVVRGATGETFDQVRSRFRSSLADIAGRHPGEKVAVVSHGGSIRAWLTELLGLPYAHRNRLSILGNTGYARVSLGAAGQSLVAWNLAPHLEST